MIAVDTSVVVALLLAWHEAHDATRREVGPASIPAHALTETYAVLTRLPRSLSPADAATLLAEAFPTSTVLSPPPGLQRSFPSCCASLGIAGGATYGAMIAFTASHHRATLLTRDRRAVSVYERVGVEFMLL